MLLFLDEVFHYFKVTLLGSYMQGSIAYYVWIEKRPRVVLEDPLGSRYGLMSVIGKLQPGRTCVQEKVPLKNCMTESDGDVDPGNLRLVLY